MGLLTSFSQALVLITALKLLIRVLNTDTGRTSVILDIRVALDTIDHNCTTANQLIWIFSSGPIWC